MVLDRPVEESCVQYCTLFFISSIWPAASVQKKTYTRGTKVNMPINSLVGNDNYVDGHSVTMTYNFWNVEVIKVTLACLYMLTFLHYTPVDRKVICWFMLLITHVHKI